MNIEHGKDVNKNNNEIIVIHFNYSQTSFPLSLRCWDFIVYIFSSYLSLLSSKRHNISSTCVQGLLLHHLVYIFYIFIQGRVDFWWWEKEIFVHDLN